MNADYQSPANLKPEIHFIGQIQGGCGFNSKDGLFCEIHLESGADWRPLPEIEM